MSEVNTLPRAVRDAAAQANALHQQFVASQTSDTPAPTPAAGDASADTGDTPTPMVSADAPTPGVTPEQSTDWEHRYRSLKGKHDAELTRLKSENDRLTRALEGLTGEVSNLQGVLASMQATRTSAPAAPVADEIPEDFRITAQEREDFGEELLTVAAKAAREKLSPEIATLKAEIARLNSQISGVQGYVQQDARTALFETLNREVPDWGNLNNDPGFLSWLRQVDPYSGDIRQKMLDAALEVNNSARVVAFFRGYLREQAAVAPSASPPQGSGTAATAPQKPSLETLAAPGRASGGTGVASPSGDKPIYSQADIARFYSDVMKGRFKGRDAEKARIEADIVAAAREGRLR